MSFLLKWLKPETSSRIGMRPHRNLEVELAIDEAYDRVLQALDRVLGASVSIDDRKTYFIEASFGLVKSERLRVTCEAIDDTLTKIHVEAYYPAGMKIAEKSAAVDALANALETGVRP